MKILVTSTTRRTHTDFYLKEWLFKFLTQLQGFSSQVSWGLSATKVAFMRHSPTASVVRALGLDLWPGKVPDLSMLGGWSVVTGWVDTFDTVAWGRQWLSMVTMHIALQSLGHLEFRKDSTPWPSPTSWQPYSGLWQCLYLFLFLYYIQWDVDI